MNNKYEMFRKELSNNADIEELLKKYTFQEIMQYYEKIINEDYDNFVSIDERIILSDEIISDYKKELTNKTYRKSL